MVAISEKTESQIDHLVFSLKAQGKLLNNNELHLSERKIWEPIAIAFSLDFCYEFGTGIFR